MAFAVLFCKDRLAASAEFLEEIHRALSAAAGVVAVAAIVVAEAAVAATVVVAVAKGSTKGLYQASDWR